MFAFNLLNVLGGLLPRTKDKNFEPVELERYKSYIPHAPCEIRKMIQKMSRCPNCHFLVFDGYWTNDIEETKAKVCPTCGCRT